MLLSLRGSERSAPRVLSLSRLEASDLCRTILYRLVDDGRDSSAGFPLLTLLRRVWAALVDEYLCRSQSAGGDRENFTLLHASEILRAYPSPVAPPAASEGSQKQTVGDDAKERLRNAIEDGRQLESKTIGLLSQSRTLLKSSLKHPELVRTHSIALRELYNGFRGRHSQGLTLDGSLEQNLDHDAKLFGWLVGSYHRVYLQFESFSLTNHSSIAGQGFPVSCSSVESG